MTNRSDTIDSAFQPGPAGQLTAKRIAARWQNHRLTYDCLSAGVAGSNLVKCKQGHQFKRADGCMPLLSVLAGRSSSICQECLDYDGEIAE